MRNFDVASDMDQMFHAGMFTTQPNPRQRWRGRRNGPESLNRRVAVAQSGTPQPSLGVKFQLPLVRGMVGLTGRSAGAKRET
jgi:hypothetical protein